MLLHTGILSSTPRTHQIDHDLSIHLYTYSRSSIVVPKPAVVRGCAGYAYRCSADPLCGLLHGRFTGHEPDPRVGSGSFSKNHGSGRVGSGRFGSGSFQSLTGSGRVTLPRPDRTRLNPRGLTRPVSSPALLHGSHRATRAINYLYYHQYK